MKVEKIPWAKPTLFGNEKEYVSDALNSTWISGGKYVNRLEESIAKYCGAKFGVAVSSGTAALHLSLLALGIGPGDEVIVPGFTFVAPANMVVGVGGTSVYADINPRTWCIDVKSIKSCISSKTKAIIPVHLYGNVCRMEEIIGLARSKNLFVIEDTAEAAFSKYKGKYAGTFADVGCYSFHATKNITTGEGGMVLTDDKKLYEKMQIIRDHGMRKDKRYWHDIIGFNFRLTNFQAALGCAQLEKVNIILKERRRVYKTYSRELNSIPGVEMQHFPYEVQPVVWTVAIRIDPPHFKGNRDWIIRKLLEAKIETRPGFYALSLMPPYNSPPLPVSIKVSKTIITLPTYPSLTEEEIIYICGQLKKLLN